MTDALAPTSRATADTGSLVRLRGLVGTRRVPVGSDLYNHLLETLYDEAAALDERRFGDWVEMLADDLRYTAPLRITRIGKTRDSDVTRSMYHFDETRRTILSRLGRLELSSAWAEDPPSRCRRQITNVRMAEGVAPGTTEAVSYLQVTRSRGDDWRTEWLTAERRDIWRAVGGAHQLVTREIILDQSVLGMANLAIFL